MKPFQDNLEGFLFLNNLFMLSKAKAKLVNALLSKKQREQHQLFRVEGSNNVLDFLHSNLEATDIFASQTWINEQLTTISRLRYEVVSESEMKQITALTTPSEVLALFRFPVDESPEPDLQQTLVLMLDDIRDPGNLGTIIRTADWFGIRQIICSKATTDTFSPKVVQASMGSLARVSVRHTDLAGYLANLTDDLPVYGALLDGMPLHEIKHVGKGIILIGSEAHGINPDLFPYITNRITIPAGPASASGKAESLNASIATAIICYELSKNNL